jgi:tetratricopeptide (TPR) repeat protein
VLAVASCAVIVPGGTFRYVLGKLLVMASALLAAAFTDRRGRLPRPTVGMLTVGAAVLLIAALRSAAPLAEVFGRWPRYEGVIALSVYLGAAWLGARLLGPAATDGDLRLFHKTCAATSLLMTFFAVLEAFGLRPLGGSVAVRPGSLMGNATEQGIIGLIFLALLVRPGLRTRHPLLIAGGFGAVLLVALSGSRGAILGTAVAIVVLAALSAFPAPSDARRPSGAPAALQLRRAVLGALGLLVVLIAAVLLVPSTRDRLLAAATVHGRLLLWGETLELLRHSPVLGVGPSGFVDAIVPFHTATWATDVGMQSPPDSPHIWLLQAWSAGGIGVVLLAVAFGIYLSVRGLRLWQAAAGARRDLDAAVLALVVGYGIAVSTHFTSAGTTPVVAMCVGALLATDAGGAPRRIVAAERRGQRFLAIGQRAAVSALVVVLALAVCAEWAMSAAFSAYARGDVASADRAFTMASTLRPWDADLPSQATQAFGALASARVPGAAALAVDWGRRAVARVPDSVQARLAYAVGLQSSGQPAAALSQLDRLHDRSPFEPTVLIQRGVVYQDTGNPVSARSDFEAAAKADPRNPLPWRLLAALLKDQGDPQGASDATRAAQERS